MTNFHVPLPETTYAQLRAEAYRSRTPATALARAAIDEYLERQAKLARHEELARFAASAAGTDLDLDPVLEAAATEHLLPRKRRR